MLKPRASFLRGSAFFSLFCAMCVLAFMLSGCADNTIRLLSDGYPMITVDLSDLEMRKSEEGTSAGLIRGMA